MTVSVEPMDLEKSVQYKFAHDAESNLGIFTSQIEKRLSRPNPEKPGFQWCAGTHHNMGLYSFSLGQLAEAEEHFRSELWFWHFHLRLGSLGEGETLALHVPGTGESVDFLPHGRSILCSTCVHVLSLASVFDDPQTMGLALHFGSQTEDGETFPTLAEPRSKLYQALFADSDSVDDALQAALLSTDPTGMYSGVAEFATVRLLPEYRLIESILGGEQADFDAAVVALHEGHVRWFAVEPEGRAPRYGNVDVLVNWELSGLVALAMRRGFSAPPRSPYMFSAAQAVDGGDQ